MPEYDEREAARFGLLTWAAYQALPTRDRALAVAHYRINRLIELHADEAVEQHMDRLRNQKGGR